MRIALIAHTNSPWAPHYAAYLHSRGHEVHVISFHPDPLPDVNVHFVGKSDRSGELPKWLYLARVRRVRRLLRKIRPDVTLATYFQSNGLVGALTKCSPLIVSTRGPDFHFGLPAFLGGPVARWVSRRADLLHASSPQLAEELTAIGVPASKFRVIPVGTDSTEFGPRVGPRPPGPPRVICTRKLDPLYDNFTLLRAFARLKRDGLDFEARFVGTGVLESETRKSARDLDLDSCVQFIGGVPHNQVADQLRWADIYTSASVTDGAASSLFEAMATQLFPVVSDIRANREWLEHRKTAFLFPVGDQAACAEGIRFALDNPAIVAAAVAANRQTVVARLDRLTNLKRLEAVLNEAVAIARNS